MVRRPRFASEGSRKSNEDALDVLIAAWTHDRDAANLETLLVRAGLLAARVAKSSDVLNDEQLAARGVLAQVEHPEAGRFVVPTTPVHLPGVPPEVVRPAPLHGEHSRVVFARLLGITDEHYAVLEADGITGSGPPP